MCTCLLLPYRSCLIPFQLWERTWERAYGQVVREAQRLERAGRAILRIEDGRAKAAEAEIRQPRRDPARKQEGGIACILDDPDRLRELREQMKKRDRKIGRQHRGSRGLTM